MIHPSSFHFKKSKKVTQEYHAREPTGRRHFPGVSRVKLIDVFKSLRRQRLRRGVSRRSLTRSQNVPPSPANHLEPAQPHLTELLASSSSRYRSSAVSILSATELDCSSGMSTSSCSLEGNLPDMEMGCHVLPRSTFYTSPSMFQLRSSSTEDYLVDQLEQHLRQLSLDASPDHIAVRKDTSSHEIPLEAYLDSLLQTIDPATSSSRALSDKDLMLISPDENVVPMILVTSVDAKHAKPLPPSSKRPSGTPFTPSNVQNYPTNLHPTKSKSKIVSDDPFTQPHGSTYLPDYNLTFRVPSAYPIPSVYAPETPTPMCCDHYGDCNGDMWEVLHPPLVAGSFSLPPFELPPLGAGLFHDMPTTRPY